MCDFSSIIVAVRETAQLTMYPFQLMAAMAPLAVRGAAQNFTIHNGQIFTPGFAVLNAPQPNTPLGGGE